MTTLEMRMCASAELRDADTQLNGLYTRLRTRLDRADRDRLASAQRRWVAFKTADCSFVANRYRQGTLGPVARLQCLLTHTKRRVVDLRVVVSGLNG